jgi:phospholipid/cholesterol/gamma-HCH transport system ATP-binding protein
MIDVRQLSKRFGEQQVLKEVDLSIERGDSAVVIGASGGGKSVLLKHIIGLMTPDSGQVLIDGHNIVGLSERELIRVRSKFGLVFQMAALFDSLTVAENVGFVLNRDPKLTRAEIDRRIARVLDLVELEGTEQKKPADLSGGMRKRVGIARAIVYEPEILLYDEPTTGLDPVVSDSIDHLIMRVCRELKGTSVVVTHDMRTARRVGNKLFLLHEGRIHASGPPEELFASKDPVVYRFVNGISDASNDPQIP